MGTRAAKRDLNLQWRSCFVWLLCLCSWRAPVPVLHCHGDVTEALSAAQADVSGSTAPLLAHLEHFHASLTELAGSHWHIHFVLPTPTPSPDGSSDHDTIPIPPLSLPGSVAHSLMDLAVEDSAQLNQRGIEINLNGPAALSSEAPRLIPLAPPRVRPKRLSPIVAFCVSRC